jgi:hypothetical protein
MKEKELQLVSFEQAKRLEELGFDWLHCDATHKWYYPEPDGNILVMDTPFTDRSVAAPSVALALKWIRDVKNQTTIVSYDYYCNVYYYLHNGNSASGEFYTYEAAESELLDELLTILEKEK